MSKKTALKISGGLCCPKCRRPMQRHAHPPNWKPKASQPFYFSYWDKCKPCSHMQMYEIAKVFIPSKDQVAMDAEYQTIVGSKPQ